MHAVYLNSQSEIVGFQDLSVGGLGGTALTPSDAFRGAIAFNARAMIIGHNHPSGSIAPSPEDISTTVALRRAGRILGIELLDHLVCAPSTDRWRSIIDLAPIPD
jgi:DNA repair protein RadC